MATRWGIEPANELSEGLGASIVRVKITMNKSKARHICYEGEENKHPRVPR